MADTELARLVRRSIAGDSTAWDALVERFAGLVYSVAKRAGLSNDDAEDVAQTTFITLYRRLGNIEQPDALAGWLSVTAAREALRTRRNSQKYVTLGEEDRTLDEVLAAEDAAADEIADLSISVEKVTGALSQLRQKCRELLSALYLEDQPSYQDISDRLGIPIGSIGPTRARCIESLRNLLKKSGYFDQADVSAEPFAASGVQD
jgi:RNA polymerase sigma factor (sigma-70 family)